MLHLHLQIVGLLLLGIFVLSLVIPRRFNWREEMARLSLLNRRIFGLHSLFIQLIILMMAALLLTMPGALLEPTPLAAAVLSGLLIFWLVRLLAQWFYYDASLWRGHAFNTFIHVLFSVIWSYFTVVFGCGLWAVVRGIS